MIFETLECKIAQLTYGLTLMSILKAFGFKRIPVHCQIFNRFLEVLELTLNSSIRFYQLLLVLK
jgi:hypothetical protein